MGTSKKDKSEKNITSTNVFIENFGFFFDQLSTGIIIADDKGVFSFMNPLAKKLLGPSGSKIRLEVSKQVGITKDLGYEIVNDFPTGDKVVRIKTEKLNLSDQSEIILATCWEVTSEWVSNKQSQILEFTANTFAQNIPTDKWVASILERIFSFFDVTGCSILMINSGKKEHEMLARVGKLPKQKNQTKIRQKIATECVKTKLAIAKYNGSISILCVPLIVSGKVVGILDIEKRPGRYFKEQDRNFYNLLANRLAITLEYRELVNRLRVERNRLSTVVTYSNQGKILLNEDNIITLTNPTFAQMFDKTAESLIGKNLIKAVPEFASVLSGNEKQAHEEFEIEIPNGTVWVGVSVVNIREKSSVSKVVSVRDITSEKYLEQLKNEFITTATHELRTPLTAILGYISILNHKGDLNDRNKLYLDRMDKAAKNLSELVEDLLSVLRLDQGEVGLNPEKKKLLPLIKEVVHIVESKMVNKSIGVTLPKKDATAYVDVTAFKRVLLNLIDNAVKYSRPDGKIKINLNGVKKEGNDFVQICVRDTGVGIPKNQQSRLFEKFYRVPNELSVEAGGTGLGLHISKRLAEQWGGTLELAESTPSGSLFCFTVPKKKTDFVQSN